MSREISWAVQNIIVEPRMLALKIERISRWKHCRAPARYAARPRRADVGDLNQCGFLAGDAHTMKSKAVRKAGSLDVPILVSQSVALARPAGYVRKASIAWAMRTLTLKPIRHTHRSLKQHRVDFHVATKERVAVDRPTLLALGRSDGTRMKGSLQIRNQPLTSPARLVCRSRSRSSPGYRARCCGAKTQIIGPQ